MSFTDTLGNPHVETFYFFYTNAAPSGWYFIPAPGSDFTVGATLGNYQSHTTGWSYSSVVCFADGTHIETPQGPVLVEELQPGDLVLLSNGKSARLQLNLKTSVSTLDMLQNPKLAPVRIQAGALGQGLPRRDLYVSRQHRMKISSPVAEHVLGTSDVLIAAIRLTVLPGIDVDDRPRTLDYHHLVFDRHQVIFAEGAPTESFYTGKEAIAALDPDVRGEIMTLFPHLIRKGRRLRPALAIPERSAQKQLVSRLKESASAALCMPQSLAPQPEVALN